MVKAPPAPIEKLNIRKHVQAPLVMNVQQEDRPRAVAKGLSFYHSGDLGDVIFSLPTIRCLGGGTLILGPDCGKDPFKTREKMTQARADLLIPLLKQQEYITDAYFSPVIPEVDFDLNQFRLTLQKSIEKSGPHENLAQLHLRHFGLNEQECQKEWIKVDRITKIKGKPVVVCRTLRYPGDLDWNRIVREYGDQIVFLGLMEEYLDFIQNYEVVYYHPTANLLEVARIIAGADLFISNQCGPHAIAEGLKQTLIQEPCPECHPAIFDRPNAWYEAPDQLPIIGTRKKRSLSITFKSSIDGFSGIGQSSGRFMLGLSERGHQVDCNPSRESHGFGLPDQRLESLRRSVGPDSIRVLYETAQEIPFFAKDGDIVMTLWESTVWPKQTVETINKCRMAIVFSKWNAETLKACGCTVPIHVIPLGIDPTIFRPMQTRPALLTFGAAARVSGAGGRKGIDTVIAAFQQAFTYQQDVRLRVKVFSDCPVDDPVDPRIEICRDHLTVEGMAGWHTGNTVFVSASKSEGWSLCLHEAMACGCAPIACKYGGQAEYFDSSVGYELPYTLADTKDSDTFKGMGQWAEPSFPSLTAIMRRINLLRDEADRFGKLAAIRAQQFSWDRSVTELEKILLSV